MMKKVIIQHPGSNWGLDRIELFIEKNRVVIYGDDGIKYYSSPPLAGWALKAPDYALTLISTNVLEGQSDGAKLNQALAEKGWLVK